MISETSRGHEPFEITDNEQPFLNLIDSPELGITYSHLTELFFSPAYSEFLEVYQHVEDILKRDEEATAVISGPMRSSKTLYALMMVYALLISEDIELFESMDQIMFLKPEGDTRDINAVASHTGVQSPFVERFGDQTNSLASLRDRLINIPVLVIDEVPHFIKSEADAKLLQEIIRERKQRKLLTIICALDEDFYARPMPMFAEFRTLASPTLEINAKAWCSRCPETASHSSRFLETGLMWTPAGAYSDLASAEGPSCYEPMCGKCHPQTRDPICKDEYNVLLGERLFPLLAVLLYDLEQENNRLLCQNGITDFRKWQSQQFKQWSEIRTNDFHQLTFWELRLLQQITETFALNLLIDPELLNHTTLVEIAGPIGTGKSLLIRRLEQLYNLPQIRESIHLIRGLGHSLGGTKEEQRKSAGLAQLGYRVSRLNSRAHEILKLQRCKSIGGSPVLTLVADRARAGDWAFIISHFINGNITQEQLELLFKLEQVLGSGDPGNHCIFGVDAELWKQAERVHTRMHQEARTFEQGLSLQFLQQNHLATWGVYEQGHHPDLQNIQVFDPRSINGYVRLDTTYMYPEDVVAQFIWWMGQWNIQLQPRRRLP